MNMRKIFLVFLISLALCVSIHAEESQLPQQFEGFNLSGISEGGQKTWDIEGDSADIIGDLIKLTNIVANAYGEEPANLTAEYGTLDKASGKMHLEKDVVITTKDGAKLTTDTLDWERNEDLVHTDDRVVLTKEGMVATGTGAVGHPNLKMAQLNENVQVDIETKSDDGSKGKVTITCDGPLEMEYNNQKATFNDNVVAVDGDRKIIADKIEAFFDTKTNQIKEMVCTGNVSIIQGQNNTFSDRAVYNAVDKKLTLSGNPKLIFYTEGDSLPFGQTDEAETEGETKVETP